MQQVQTNEIENETMAPDSTQPIELRIERTFDAPCETVFDAWIERDQASQ